MSTPVSHPYVLGDSAPEVRRLIEQSDLYAAATEDALRRAGIREGMDVLDVGAGAGGVTLLLSGLVGTRGSVVALDSSAEMLQVTTARAASAGCHNVSVLRADLTDLDPPRRFDAVVGRLVLMHVPDPVDVVRRLAGSAVRTGGLVAFSEFAMSFAGARPPGPLFTRTLDRVVETFTRAGRPVDMGLMLPRTFRAAGLSDPASQVGGVLGESGDEAVHRLLADTARALLPVSERVGLVPPGTADQDSLAERLAEESRSLGSVGIPPLLVTTWARVPA
jgi:SAM-dependent methyltransferase